MAVPLLLFAAGTLLRAAGPKIAQQLIKAGARKATQKQIAQGGAKVVNNNNLGVVKTALRPKSGGAAPKPTAPKPKTGSGSAPKTTPKKPASSGGAKKAPKKSPKKPPKKDLKPDPKEAPPSVQARAARNKPKPNANAAKKQSPFGSKTQRALLVAATTAPAFAPGNSKDTAKADNKGPRNLTSKERAAISGMGNYKPKSKTDGESFSAAFARARKKGVGTKFTFKGNQYAAVRDSDIPASIKGTKKERLQKFLNQRKQKGKK